MMESAKAKTGAGRLPRHVLFGLTTLAVIFGIAIVLGALVPLDPKLAKDDGPGHHRIRIVASAIHTDIAIPVDADLAERLGFLRDAGLPVERADWVLFGRGGRSFYLETPNWSDLRLGPLARALTLDAAVMHVALSGPFEADGTVREYDLSDAT